MEALLCLAETRYPVPHHPVYTPLHHHPPGSDMPRDLAKEPVTPGARGSRGVPIYQEMEEERVTPRFWLVGADATESSLNPADLKCSS